MEIFYQGANITDMVQTRKCIVRDRAGSRCDSMELEFENASGWYAWGPREDDQIIVAHEKYNSGIMYVNTILPKDGRYRIIATALPCAARKKQNRSFIGQSLEEIMRSCAFSSGMGFQMFGIDGDIVIPYIEQDNEGAALFLHKLLALEGALLKCVNGKYTAIGIEYAQEQEALQSIELSSKQENVQYQRSGKTYRSVTIKTPYAEASAEDFIVPENHMRLEICTLPAMNNIQARRWARGKLFDLNRQSETVIMQSEFNPAFTAMSRMDFEGDTDATGQWLAEEAEHDLVNLTTEARLHRCITTIL